jgi:uncharacterized protein YjbJ (UPF0337 family)
VADDQQDSTVESVIGRAKEAIGSATGADSTRDEGRAQQNKAEAQDKVAKKEAELKEAKSEEKGEQARENQHKG